MTPNYDDGGCPPYDARDGYPDDPLDSNPMMEDNADTSCLTGDERAFLEGPYDNSDEAERQRIADGGGGFDEYGNRVEPSVKYCDETGETYPVAQNPEVVLLNPADLTSPPCSPLDEADLVCQLGIPACELEEGPTFGGYPTPDQAAIDELLGASRRPASVIAPGMKDTNPKDGVGSLKPSYSSVPVPVLYEIGAALGEGARKYGGYNWRVAGVRTSVYIDATRRHLDAFWEGEDVDPDSGLSHITKAIASLTVFRDAQIQGMVSNDDRPPSSQVPYMRDTQERVTEIAERYPNPVPSFTQAEIQHTRNVPVNVYGGDVLGYEIEVMLPAPGVLEGFVWSRQGDRRGSIEHALAVAQALRDDGYSERVVRITMVSDRVDEMANGDQYVAGEMRKAVATAFPGDGEEWRAFDDSLDSSPPA